MNQEKPTQIFDQDNPAHQDTVDASLRQAQETGSADIEMSLPAPQVPEADHKRVVIKKGALRKFGATALATVAAAVPVGLIAAPKAAEFVGKEADKITNTQAGHPDHSQQTQSLEQVAPETYSRNGWAQAQEVKALDGITAGEQMKDGKDITAIEAANEAAQTAYEAANQTAREQGGSPPVDQLP